MTHLYDNDYEDPPEVKKKKWDNHRRATLAQFDDATLRLELRERQDEASKKWKQEEEKKIKEITEARQVLKKYGLDK